MRYIVSEGAIGPEGRTVRCAHCGHEWFEDGETGLDEALFGAGSSSVAEDIEFAQNLAAEFAEEGDAGPARVQAQAEGQEDSAQDFEEILRKEMAEMPIPAGVQPVSAAEDPVLAQLGSKKAANKGDKITGYLLAAALWACVLAALLMLQPQISRAWPPSNMFYGLVGLKPVPPGEGLGLDSLQAEIADGRIRMSGDILNLQHTDLKVPSVMASIVDAEGKMIDRVLIAPPVARLKAEGKVSFDVVFPKVPDGAANVTFAFSFISVPPQEAPQIPADKAASTP